MQHSAPPESLNRTALQATVHCLTGCAIGEILGLAIGTTLGWDDLPTILLAIVLAFVFGYGLTMLPLLRRGLPVRAAVTTAFAADTISIATMEIVDNAIIVAVPGAMDAGLTSLLFWSSLVFALAVAFVVTFPVNRWMISRGLGHAAVHGRH
jgi:formate/nitrite transporter FocA (FNT family)